MNRRRLIIVLTASSLLAAGTAGLSTAVSGKTSEQGKRKPKMAKQDTLERADLPPEHKWNTEHLFPSDQAWEKERKALVGSFKELAGYKGRLSQSKQLVKTCLDRAFAARKRLARLVGYAHRKYDEDTRVGKYQGFKEVAEKVATDFLEVTSFIEPELLKLPAKQLQAMIKDKDFSDYDQYLKDMLRLKPHILSPEQEELLAAASLMRDAGYNTYSTFTGADLSFPTVRDDKGRKVKLTQALFGRYRASDSRKVRRETFEAFFGTFQDYRNTLATMLGTQVNANIVYSRARKYGSALEAALGRNNIPTSVYHNMIKAVNKHLPTLHRYLALRQKLLGLKELRYYDMYPPMIKKVDLKYPYEESQALLVQALAPMGQAYTKVLAQGLDPKSGWIDPFPTTGKRSGAYMDGSAYDVHPFVLANYLGDYNSLSTLAHEMGHAMHSHLTNAAQPFAKADYSIFVAEVASTLNEALLMREMLKTVKGKKKRLYLLGEQLESFRQTLFRQAMFAEFELALYQRAERKEPLTADAISALYLEIVRRYYGHDKGVVTVDDLYGQEWAYIPHFYYNFYVFQYVTGITAATALAEKIVTDGPQARDRYIKHLLQAGNSDYSVTLLKNAGVDLTVTEPYDVALSVFSRAIDEVEALVAQK